MKFRLSMLPQARRDIDRNADWWAEHHSVEQALRWSDAVYDQIETLADFPESNDLIDALHKGKADIRSAPEWQLANAMAPFLNHNYGSCHQFSAGLIQDSFKPLDDMSGSSVVQTEQHYADDLPRAIRQNFSEVKIKRQYNSLLSMSFLEYLPVGKSLQSLFSKMHNFVAFPTKPLNDSH